MLWVFKVHRCRAAVSNLQVITHFTSDSVVLGNLNVRLVGSKVGNINAYFTVCIYTERHTVKYGHNLGTIAPDWRMQQAK